MKLTKAPKRMQRDIEDTYGFEQLLFEGGCNYKNILEKLPIYRIEQDFVFDTETTHVIEIEGTMAGIVGYMVSIYIQTEGDCLFLIQKHPDGSEDGLLHSLYYVSQYTQQDAP